MHRLAMFVTPPTNALYGRPPANWQSYNASLNITVPKPLEDFARVYGSGAFDSDRAELCVYNPYDPQYWKKLQRDQENYIMLKSKSPRQVQSPICPDRNGIVPFGYLDTINLYLQLDALSEIRISIDEGGRLRFLTSGSMEGQLLELLHGPAFEGEIKFYSKPLVP